MKQIFRKADVEAALTTEAAYRGTGSFGEVWRATYQGHEAGFKIIHGDGYDATRLRREIEGYQRVSNPHVVRLYDVITVDIADASRPVLVFEFIPGHDLAEAVTTRRPTTDELRALTLGLLSGVGSMHAADLLHRDLKPANIALRDGDFDKPVILDLGLAKLLDVESVTNYPTLLGTTLYMAPEQLRSERALKASDLWALGEIVYEVATGRHPFFAPGERLTLTEALDRLGEPPQRPDMLSDEMWDFISRSLNDPPYKRGTLTKAAIRIAGEKYGSR